MQSRKWQLTINNPSEKGITHDVLKESLAKFTGMLYWCMCDETGSEGTYHTHVYFVLRTPTVHTGVENRFPNIHRENVKGTSQQNRDYVLKEGEKYNKLPDGSYDYTDGSGKTHTGVNHTATFEEWGDMPQEHQGKSKDVEKIYALIKDGATNLEIIDAVPSGMMNTDKIERTRSILRDAHFADDWRDLHVTYIFGTTGSGKTRSVMDKYGYRNCYRVTDYKHPFDSYNGQDVLIFEEYRSQFRIADMLNYLDGYPIELPCRYFNRQACYTKVFIISNLPLEKQYTNVIQESRAAFYRRIHQVRAYQDGTVLDYGSLSSYFSRPAFVPVDDAENSPWGNNE